MRLRSPAIAGRGAPAAPVPSSASIARPTEGQGPSADTSRTPSARPSCAISSRNFDPSPEAATQTGTSARCSARAMTQPSPPLLPGPAATRTPVRSRWAYRFASTAAEARPAFSINVASPTPTATALSSQLLDCSGVRTGMVKERGEKLSLVALPYRPAEADLAIFDAQVEPAIGIGADPCLVGDGSSLAAVVRKWDQGPLGAFLAARPFLALHVPLQIGIEGATRRAGPANRRNRRMRRRTRTLPRSRTPRRPVG